MSAANRKAAPPTRFRRVHGKDYRLIALGKRKEEMKIKLMLEEAKKIERITGEQIDVDPILKEGLKRLTFLDNEYDKLQRRRKRSLYNGGEPCDLLPRKRRKTHHLGTEIVLEPHKSIFPGYNYPKITNFVVTVHFGKDGKDLYVDQHRIPLYIPNAVKNNSFAAVIIPQDGATALFFSNCKTVMTGTTTPESALFALQMYRLSLSRVLQPVIVRDNTTSPVTETYEICYLKTILDFTGFKGTNTVGSGPIAKDGYTVDLSALIEVYPETNWKPEIFPGLKFHLPEGNKIIPGGKKCTAHLFEGRIVLMGLEAPEHIVIAYYFFLELVKPFLDKSSPDYEEDKYSYRYKQMLWKLNEDDQSQSQIQDKQPKTLQDRRHARRTKKSVTFAQDSNQVLVSDADSTVSVNVRSLPQNKSNSLFDFDIEGQLPPEMLKKMRSTMRASSKIKKSTTANSK